MKIIDKLTNLFKRQAPPGGGILILPNTVGLKGLTPADFEKLSYIYTCAEVRAENFASASLYVEDEAGNIRELEEVEEIANLFTSLGLFSQFEFFYLSCMIRDLISNGVYYYIVRDSKGKPLSFFIVPPSTPVKAVYNPKNRFEVLYYEIYTGEGYTKIAPEDVINIKRLNFYNFFTGFSILQQYEDVIKTYLELTSFLHSQASNYALPPKLVIKVDNNVAEAVIKQMRQRWLEKREQFLRGEDILITQGEIQQLGPSVQELDYANTRRLFREEIRSAFRVPKILLGETDEINRATAEVSRRAFIENVINPLWRFYLSKINTFLKKEYKVRLTFDYIQSMPFDELSNTLRPLYREGIITLNEIREDLGYNRLVGGDKRQVALNMVMEEIQYEDSKTRERRPIKRGAKKEPSFLAWARNNRVFEKGAKKIKPVVLDLFERQEREIISRLRKIERRDLLDDLFYDWDAWVEEIKRAWELALRSIVEIALKRSEELLEVEVVSFDEFFVEQAILRGLRRVEEINDFTRELLARQIRQGIMRNESIDELVQRIKSVFEGLKTWRAERIAWTESTSVSNATLMASFKRNDIEKKMWLSMRDDRVRDSHKNLDGQIVGINEHFRTIKGNLLLYPGDPSAPPGEVVNCRCTIVPL